MDYGVFKQTDGYAYRKVRELFHDLECDDPEMLAKERLQKDLQLAKRLYRNVVVDPDGNGFTVIRMFGSFRVFIESGIFDYE